MKEESSQPPNDWRSIQEDDLDVSDKPDEHTKKSFVQGGAPGQVFSLNLFGVKYGTDDKVHSAAVFLSILVLILLGIVFVLGTFVDRSWISTAIQTLGPVFTFLAGVAVGKSIEGK